jgi:UDPglucose 6-dehydrogenase
MKVGIYGIWHLGAVTAACLAHKGHDVTAVDPDATKVARLQAGKQPIFEPGLEALAAEGLASGRLYYTTALESLRDVDVLWVTFDTPVDSEDRADTEFVLGKVQEALPFLRAAAVVLLSSQLPVGTTAALEKFAATTLADRRLEFASSPENLRLGKAIDVFLQPDRIVVGTRSPAGKERLTELLSPISEHIEWMSVESAEMTKHGINAFLALSVTFANELASLCERVGADAREVERGLKTESRIGPRAYLSPGGAFAGGTLARDVAFLTSAASNLGVDTPLLDGVRPSNESHKGWAGRILTMALGSLDDRTIAVWGLTYKPGTDTLRRSMAVEFVDSLLVKGVRVKVFDPAVRELPVHWIGKVEVAPSAIAALDGADALVVGTEWPEFRELAAQVQLSNSPGLTVIDANRHLRGLNSSPRLRYYSVGCAS